MKFSVVSIAFAVTTAVVSANNGDVPRPLHDHSKPTSDSHQELTANHWIGTAPAAAKEAPLTMAISSRGGAQLDIRRNKALWAALAFNTIGALSTAFKPGLIFAHLVTFGGGGGGWCREFLAIMWLGAAYHTFLGLQDGAGAVTNAARQVNIVTTGLACLLGVWQYSQGVYDHQHALGFIVVTGGITAALVNTARGGF